MLKVGFCVLDLTPLKVHFLLTSNSEITFKNDKKFEWFINTIDTILANPDKKLNYYIKNKQDRVGSISNSIGINTNPFIWFSSPIDSGVSMTFPQRELDSLRACYVRYKEESN